jgi:D-alanyl-D-alanine carboxypeptidase (penicillin-binding protein 5/6)
MVNPVATGILPDCFLSMRLKSILVACLVVVAGAMSAGVASARASGAYKGAIATDAETGAVLFEDNADLISPPASMTKLMTYAVLDDEIRKGTIALTTPVEITREDAKVALIRDSTEVWLRQGETFPVEELIYAMMIQSANDAAYALAHKAGGTVGAFVAMMNVKARELGMANSTFRSPNGFPPPNRRIADGDLTTPRDYAKLCRYLLLHTDILKYTSVKSRTFGAGIRLQPVLMNNHNNLLGRIPGVDGLKTGFTSGAGFCLSATAQRNGHRIIVVMMDSPDSRTRDLHVQDLITQAFIRLPITEAPFVRTAPGKGEPMRPTPEPAPIPSSETGPVIHMPTSG